jgi:hypothetical protein
MANTRMILSQLPDFHKKSAGPSTQETKLPPKAEKTEFECTWWEQPKIYEDYKPLQTIKISA